MDQHATRYKGNPRPRPHYVRWGHSSPSSKKGHSPHFLLWSHGRPISATAEHLLNCSYVSINVNNVHKTRSKHWWRRNPSNDNRWVSLEQNKVLMVVSDITATGSWLSVKNDTNDIIQIIFIDNFMLQFHHLGWPLGGMRGCFPVISKKRSPYSYSTTSKNAMNPDWPFVLMISIKHPAQKVYKQRKHILHKYVSCLACRVFKITLAIFRLQLTEYAYQQEIKLTRIWGCTVNMQHIFSDHVKFSREITHDSSIILSTHQLSCNWLRICFQPLPDHSVWTHPCRAAIHRTNVVESRASGGDSVWREGPGSDPADQHRTSHC